MLNESYVNPLDTDFYLDPYSHMDTSYLNTPDLFNQDPCIVPWETDENVKKKKKNSPLTMFKKVKK